MASLNTIKNLAPFPQLVSDQLKQVLSTGERQVKALVADPENVNYRKNQ